MYLRSITLKNFRTYKAESLTFHERFNLIVGDNAQGKTNLLEAVYLLCKFRPFKQVKNEELIRLGSPSAGVKGEIEAENGLNEIHISITPRGKNVRVNGKVLYNLSSYRGKFNVVLYLPSNLSIVKGSPSVRRRYIDNLIANLDPKHLSDIRAYYRTLGQRNRILSRSRTVLLSEVEIWDEKLSEVGARIVSRRLRAIEKLEKILKKIYATTSGVKSAIDVRYLPSYKIEGDIEGSLKKSLAEGFKKDKKRGHTTLGPHRDVITFYIDGKDTSSFASQGESKNLILALKATEISMYRTLKDKKPILLLDDITSELDRNRKNFLFNLLLSYSGQIFVTSTSEDEIPYSGEKRVFRVKEGRAEVLAPSTTKQDV